VTGSEAQKPQESNCVTAAAVIPVQRIAGYNTASRPEINLPITGASLYIRRAFNAVLCIQLYIHENGHREREG
jgi:hypothetical protein